MTLDLVYSMLMVISGNSTDKYQVIYSTQTLFVSSLRLEIELSNRLIPMLSTAANENSVLDFQDILKRFTFDNICQIAFGFDPEYLPSPPATKMAVAFEDAGMISGNRFIGIHPIVWKLKRALNIGSEKCLNQTI